MSAEGDGPRDDGRPDPADDPFAFAPDAHDEERAAGTDADAEDGRRERDDDAGRGTAGRGDRRRGAEELAAEAEAAREARAHEVADRAATHARAVGARWLAVAAVVFVVLIGVTSLTGGRGPQGGDVEPGETLPAFAAPLVSQPRLQGGEDVNLAREDDQGQAGRRAACSIRNRSVVTSCALLRRGPLVLVLFSRGIGACVGAVDELDRLRRRYPAVQALAVSLLGRWDSTRETARERRWTLPVVYDRDGALAQALGAPACPLVLFVRRDGTVQERVIGRLEPGRLERGIRDLLRPRSGTGTTVDPAPPAR
jgi:hypothetical protein